MELEQLDKHIHLTPTATGVEVMFAGLVCLSVYEAADGYLWKINPIFAKLTYGANVFEDVPWCFEATDTLEESIASGLEKLHTLGAFNKEVDLPEDTYVEAHLDESAEEQIDELSDVVKHSYVAKAARNRDAIEDSLDAIAASGAKVDTSKLKKKSEHREIGMQKVNSRFPKEVGYSLREDCRKEALKHCDSLMEAHDLAQGLYDSFIEELDEAFKMPERATYDKVESHSKKTIKAINRAKSDPTPENKQSAKDHREHLNKLTALRNKQIKNGTLKSSYSSMHGGHIIEELDEAYGATKKAYDPFASAISKVMSRPAFSAVPKDEPEAAPAVKKKGRPTNIDIDAIKEKALENIKAGKRPTHLMDRNEKIHFVRHLKDHHDFSDSHVSKAGRTHGTTKTEMSARKDAVKASKVDNVMASWMSGK